MFRSNFTSDRDRRNGIPGQDGERIEMVDVPGLGGRYQLGFGRRAESEAAQMPWGVYLHQR